jgi:hypothetical protein
MSEPAPVRRPWGLLADLHDGQRGAAKGAAMASIKMVSEDTALGPVKAIYEDIKQE